MVLGQLIIGVLRSEDHGEFTLSVEFHVLESSVFASKFQLCITNIGQFASEPDRHAKFELQAEFVVVKVFELVVSPGAPVRELGGGTAATCQFLTQAEDTVESHHVHLRQEAVASVGQSEVTLFEFPSFFTKFGTTCQCFVIDVPPVIFDEDGCRLVDRANHAFVGVGQSHQPTQVGFGIQQVSEGLIFRGTK